MITSLPGSSPREGFDVVAIAASAGGINAVRTVLGALPEDLDLLFESVAGAYGDRAIGVVLTGTGVDLDDGSTSALVVPAVSRIGRSFTCAVTVAPLDDEGSSYSSRRHRRDE